MINPKDNFYFSSAVTLWYLSHTSTSWLKSRASSPAPSRVWRTLCFTCSHWTSMDSRWYSSASRNVWVCNSGGKGNHLYTFITAERFGHLQWNAATQRRVSGSTWLQQFLVLVEQDPGVHTLFWFLFNEYTVHQL